MEHQPRHLAWSDFRWHLPVPDWHTFNLHQRVHEGLYILRSIQVCYRSLLKEFIYFLSNCSNSNYRTNSNILYGGSGVWFVYVMWHPYMVTLPVHRSPYSNKITYMYYHTIVWINEWSDFIFVIIIFICEINRLLIVFRKHVDFFYLLTPALY